LPRLWLAADPLRKAAAIDKLQREVRQSVVLAHFIDLHDAGMLQMGDRFSLGGEAGQLFCSGMRAGENHFQSHHAIEARLPGFIDHTHSAAAELLQYRITVNGGARWTGRSKAA